MVKVRTDTKLEFNLEKSRVKELVCPFIKNSANSFPCRMVYSVKPGFVYSSPVLLNVLLLDGFLFNSDFGLELKFDAFKTSIKMKILEGVPGWPNP